MLHCWLVVEVSWQTLESLKKKQIYDFKGSLKQQPHFQHRPEISGAASPAQPMFGNPRARIWLDSTFFGWEGSGISGKIVSTWRLERPEIGEGVCSIHPDILHVYIYISYHTFIHVDMCIYLTYISLDRYVIISSNTDMSDGYRHCAIEMRYHPIVLQVHVGLILYSMYCKKVQIYMA